MFLHQSFPHRAQDVFKQALQTNDISLRVLKNNTESNNLPLSKGTVLPKPGEARKKPGLTIAISPTKTDGDGQRTEERKVAQVGKGNEIRFKI